MLGPSEDLQTHAVGYVGYRALGCIGLTVWMVLGSFYRGIGDRPEIAIGAGGADALRNMSLDEMDVYWNKAKTL